ncbi:MAG: LEA type 2 family protein [Gammaproteobacteria bacterium]|nr:LEA type 2 family protein [Gammaproteobacteria bacterium]
MIAKVARTNPWRLALVALLIGLSGCAGLATRLESPRVSLANLQLEEFGVFEQRYRLSLRVQNPNDVELPIAGMEFRLYLNDEEFAHGLSDQRMTLPAFGEQLVEVQVTSGITGILGQIQRLGRGELKTFSYRLAGHVKPLHRALKYPFEYRGEIDLKGSGLRTKD